ncbi:MAG TPA: PEP-CTERM sorting domain-containing protein [Verrucomicrobiae bacterium]|nr:PEP-CTERM sorting domain-containing protein [Verrucomicrobiae bacterium]
MCKNKTATKPNLAVSLLIAAFLAFLATPAHADTVHLYSGASTDGTYDDNIHMLTGPIDGPLTDDLTTSAPFTASLSGPSAYVVTPNDAWVQGFGYVASDAPDWDWEAYFNGDYGDIDPFAFISTSPAQWISSDPNGAQGGSFTALYSMNFTLPDFSAASFNIQFAADQTLGTTADDGIYLNGIALTGSGGGDYSDVITLNYDDVASLLHSGTNTLSLYNANYGGPSGVLFDANVDFTPAPIPEPTTVALFTLTAMCAITFRRRML